MSRWAAGVEYLGTAYAGFQRQSHAPSVQQELETALARVANAPLGIHAAGRTDAGVHALGQVVHFDSDASRTADNWLMGANTHLPDDIALRWLQPVNPDFHARHSARARSYRYLIAQGRGRSPLLQGRAAQLQQQLDVSAMRIAGNCLLGELDFSAFRAAECQSRTAMRCVQALQISASKQFVSIDIRANAFLHHMVRNIVGSLILVGRGQCSPSWLEQVLAGRDRSAAGPTAPACGLYFVAAHYGPEHGLPEPVQPWLPFATGEMN